MQCVLLFLLAALVSLIHAQQYPAPENVRQQLQSYYSAPQPAVGGYNRPRNAVLEEVNRAYPQYSSKRLLRFLVDKYKRDLASTEGDDRDQRHKRYGRIGGTIVMGR